MVFFFPTYCRWPFAPENSGALHAILCSTKFREVPPGRDFYYRSTVQWGWKSLSLSDECWASEGASSSSTFCWNLSLSSRWKSPFSSSSSTSKVLHWPGRNLQSLPSSFFSYHNTAAAAFKLLTFTFSTTLWAANIFFVTCTYMPKVFIAFYAVLWHGKEVCLFERFAICLWFLLYSVSLKLGLVEYGTVEGGI